MNIVMSRSQTPEASKLAVASVASGFQREAAYRKLRRLLILQQIPAGSRLTEAEWTGRLDVNRSALREAFVRLEAEGLLKIGAKSGYFVPELGADDVFDVLSVRLALEGAAIELICRAGLNTPEHLARMQDACDLFEHLVNEDYELSAAEADWRYHEELIEAAGNRRLAIAYRHAPLLMQHPHIAWGAEWVRQLRQNIGEHRAILKAILGGDVDEAKKLLRTHLLAYGGLHRVDEGGLKVVSADD